MCQTCDFYKDRITSDTTNILVNALLVADTNYIWEVTDSLDNQYLIPFTTDSNGFGVLPAASLPAGFINYAVAPFTVRVKPDVASCDYIPLVMLSRYEAVSVSVARGAGKNFVGCAIDIGSLQQFTSGELQFTGTDGQTTYQNDSIIGTKQIIVFNETGVVSLGTDFSQYQYNNNTGTITFGQPISGQRIVIYWFK